MDVRVTNAANAAVVAAIAAAATVACDGRHDKRPIRNHFLIGNDLWGNAQEADNVDGWYMDNFRCCKAHFEQIVHRIEAEWEEVNPPLYHNCRFWVRDRVAVTLHYLTHEGGFKESGQVFGMSRTRAQSYTQEVINVLCQRYRRRSIKLPENDGEWWGIAAGFESICGFPNVVGAIDGSLFEVKRFDDFDGWYCRKGFPAFNMQALVDHKKRFRSISIRSGSQNDKGLFNMSHLGRRIQHILPPGTCIVGDAGYKLLTQVMTPYAIGLAMTKSERNYNYLHSRTRIVVEGAFGLLKERFRMFKCPLLHSSPQAMANFIIAAVILHNWLIDMDEETLPVHVESWMHMGGDSVERQRMYKIDGSKALQARESIKHYLWKHCRSN